jgi:hypothetical protein
MNSKIMRSLGPFSDTHVIVRINEDYVFVCWPDTRDSERGSASPITSRLLEVMTGLRQLEASAILDYFKPLQAWLKKQNNGVVVGPVISRHPLLGFPLRESGWVWEITRWMRHVCGACARAGPM